MRVVFDSNVIIAAFATEGLCHSLFELCIRGHEVVVSEGILREVEEKLRKKVKLPPAAVRERLTYLKNHCLVGRTVPVPADACRDPDDLAVLGLAVGTHADCLVTGDQDLLVLERHDETVIRSPRQLYERLRRLTR